MDGSRVAAEYGPEPPEAVIVWCEALVAYTRQATMARLGWTPPAEPTRRQEAETLNIPPATYSRWRRGRTLPHDSSLTAALEYAGADAATRTQLLRLWRAAKDATRSNPQAAETAETPVSTIARDEPSLPDTADDHRLRHRLLRRRPPGVQRLRRRLGGTKRRRMGTLAAALLLPALAAVVAWSLHDHDRANGRSADEAERRRTAAVGSTATATPDPSPSPDPATVRLCAYVVTDEPAPVYSQPDVRTQRVKSKYKTDRVEVLDTRHPGGWFKVKTPSDPPGSAWMQAATLTTPLPCGSPMPGAG